MAPQGPSERNLKNCRHIIIPMLSRRVTPHHVIEATSPRELDTLLTSYLDLLEQSSWLASVHLGKWCWVNITGEYSGDDKRLRYVLGRHAHYLRGMFMEGNRIYMSANVGPSMDWRELLYELFIIGTVLPDKSFLSLTLHDSPVFADGEHPLAVAKILVARKITVQDNRLAGVEQQREKIRDEFDRLCRQLDYLDSVLASETPVYSRDRLLEWTESGASPDIDLETTTALMSKC